MPYPNEHAARLHAPSKYDRIRRANGEFGAGIDVIYGRRRSDGKWEIQAIRFDRTKFTEAEARKWLREHKYRPIEFEPASASKSIANEYSSVVVDVADQRPVDVAKGDVNMAVTGNVDVLGKDLDDLFSDPSKRTISKAEMRRRMLEPANAYIACKASTPTAKNGTIEGYASVWDVVDAQGEVVRKGAFTKTIAEAGSKLPLMIVHFRNGGDVMSAVGSITELKETDYGLWFAATWLGDELSQKVRERCLELAKADITIGSSIGYKTINYGFTQDSQSGRTYVELRELALKEITITLKPANERALVTSAKEADDVTDWLPALKPIVDAKTDEMTIEQKTQTIVDIFGSVERATSFGCALKGIAEKTLGLATDEPQSTASADGSTSSNESQADSGKDTHDADESTTHAADQDSIARRDEAMRMQLRRLSVLAKVR